MHCARKPLHRPLAALALLALACCSGCASLDGPRPWEKDLLARPEMTMESDPLSARFAQHMYASKEAAAGGWGVGGGGCGCN